MRRRCASQSCAACGSSGIAGRSASASSGRCASPLARSIWRRAAVRSGSTTPRNPAARTSRKPAPKAKSAAAWARPGSNGSRLNRARTRKEPRIASAGQQAGQTRSHSSAARARRSRAANGAADSMGGSSGRAIMRHLASLPGRGRRPRAGPRASPELYPATAIPDSSAAPGSRRNGRRRPIFPAPAGGCCRSSS